MATIKIFIASSEELDYERQVIGNLVRRLDDIYEAHDTRIKLFEWEDFDAAYNDKRKQDEYNEKVRESDIFLALFHLRGGKFTIEEFNEAWEKQTHNSNFKAYVYFRELENGEVASDELKKFQEQLKTKKHPYVRTYANRDSLKLQLVAQLLCAYPGLRDAVSPTNDGDWIMLGGQHIARVSELPEGWEEVVGALKKNGNLERANNLLDNKLANTDVNK